MAADEFQAVSSAITRSYVARALASAGRAYRTALPGSSLGQPVARLCNAAARTSIVTRIRLSGMLLIAGTLTHDALSLFVPPSLRPSLSGILQLDVLALSIVLVWAAPPLERAWRSSLLRRLVQRLAS
jgi:hypothetical protein